jgi:hypothetical protein
VPHAVIRIAEHERQLLDNHGVAFIRLRFAKIARLCLGHQVVLYQSARNIGAYKLPVGYFAIARVANLLQLPGANSRRCALYLDEFIPLDPARTMVELGRAVEPGLMATAGHFEGWKASEDVRPISDEQFQSFLAERQGVPSTSELDPTAMVPVEYLNRRGEYRDPIFRQLLLEAYCGICAISGVSLPFARRCGLEAAHIVPYALRPKNEVTAGILLAPTWHDRFDEGAIIIHDDYTWFPVIEDGDTDAISSRRLLLPARKSEWPDIKLLREKRKLFGFL